MLRNNRRVLNKTKFFSETSWSRNWSSKSKRGYEWKIAESKSLITQGLSRFGATVSYILTEIDPIIVIKLNAATVCRRLSRKGKSQSPQLYSLFSLLIKMILWNVTLLSFHTDTLA